MLLLFTILVAFVATSFYQFFAYNAAPHVVNYGPTKTNYATFNPCKIVTDPFNVTVYRYSNDSLCKSMVSKKVAGYIKQNILGIKKQLQSFILMDISDLKTQRRGFLDTSEISTEASFEDPRIVSVDPSTVAISCSYYKDHNCGMCIMFLKPLDFLKNSAPIKPFCSKLFYAKDQRQKNWMMYPETPDTLLLYASIENNIIYELHYKRLLGHTALQIPNVKLGSWYGSTPFTNVVEFGALGIVHKRKYDGWNLQFVHAFVKLNEETGLHDFSRPFVFKIKECETQFTYISGLLSNNDSVELYFGLHDCYALRSTFSLEFVKYLFLHNTDKVPIVLYDIEASALTLSN